MIKSLKNPNKFLFVRSVFREIEASYRDDCCHHDVEAVDLSDYLALINFLGEKIKSGELSPSDLNADLVEKIYNDVSKPVKTEYGKKFIDYDYKEPGSLIQKFKKNLWQFSCAKTLAELEQVNQLLLDKNGRVKPDHLFKDDLKKANFQFNHNYLQAEIQTAKRGAQMAHLWSKFVEQSHIYPNLVYRTVGDDRVRPDHAILNGIVKPVDDPFWRTYYPPNGWRCRCTVMNTSEDITPVKYDDPTVQPEFHGNTALDEEIFTEKGSFFKLLNKDFKAQENAEYLKYNMPLEIAYHGKKQKKVKVSPYADPSDLKNNVESAMVIADELNIDVNLRAHINVQNKSNPEYFINGMVSDLKKIDSKNGVINAVDSAKKQFKDFSKHSLVIDFTNVELSKDDIISQLNNKVTKSRGKKIQEMIFINKTKAVLLSREDIINQKFDDLDRLF